MKNYSIDFVTVTRKGEELALRMEFQREHFTNREYKDLLIRTLFGLATEGPDYVNLTAHIKRDAYEFLTVACDTEADGSEITAYLRAARPREKYRHLRAMRIGY